MILITKKTLGVGENPSIFFPAKKKAPNPQKFWMWIVSPRKSISPFHRWGCQAHLWAFLLGGPAISREILASRSPLGIRNGNFHPACCTSSNVRSKGFLLADVLVGNDEHSWPVEPFNWEVWRRKNIRFAGKQNNLKGSFFSANSPPVHAWNLQVFLEVHPRSCWSAKMLPVHKEHTNLSQETCRWIEVYFTDVHRHHSGWCTLRKCAFRRFLAHVATRIKWIRSQPHFCPKIHPTFGLSSNTTTYLPVMWNCNMGL